MIYQRKRTTDHLIRFCLAFLLLVAAFITGWRGQSASASLDVRAPLVASPLRPAITARAAELPLSFEANRGQTDRRVRFLSRGDGYDLFLEDDQAVVELRAAATSRGKDNSPSQTSVNHASHLFKLKLDGANRRAVAKGADELPGKKNYFIGNDPRKWQTDVPTFRAVTYEDIYPGINLSYYGNQRQLEYDFQVAPGADPNAISFNCVNANHVSISGNGDLVIQINGDEIREHKPVIYQQVEGHRRVIDGGFVIKAQRKVGFDVGAYDHTQPLVIDPTLVYSTYLGGAGDDSGSSIDIDNSGNVYITGTTASLNFPTTNPAQAANAGLADIFVTKLSSTGTSVVYSTYIGGSGSDRADGIFVDKTTGAVYLAGRVDSTSTNFPTTPGAFASTYRGGDFDAIALKLNAQGNGLIYSTFIGGNDNDSAIGIFADANGNAYVTGGTRSAGFPTTPTAYQGFGAGDTDAYLMKLNASGSGLLYSTLLGGSGTDRGSSVKVDSAGVAYLVGYTSSLDFPTESAFQNSLGGSFDTFVAKIDTTANGAASLTFCSYLGGVADDKGYGLALDASNNMYIAGQTSSIDFPVLNPAQPARGGNFDGFVAKISSSGTKVYATYLGGSGDDRATGIAINSAGNAYVTGYTASTNFPTASPLQSTNAGGTDAFVAKLSTSGNALVYSTYFGGSANEDFTSTTTFSGNIAVDSNGQAYITGYTASNNFPTLSPFQATNAGGASDAFVAKISDAAPAADFTVTASPASQTVNPSGGTTFTLTVTPTGGFTGSVTPGVNGLSSDAIASFNPAAISITDSNPKTSVLTITTTALTPPGIYPLTITGTIGNLQHSSSSSLIVSGPTSANLAIVKTASPNPAIVGANVTYRIVVTNSGPSPATNATVTDNLVVGPTFVSATPTQGACSGTTTVTCNLGSLASGASATVNIVVVPQSVGQLSNTASVAATESDPDTSNDSSTVNTTVTTQSSGPSMLDPNLSVQTVITGLSQPTSMAFIGPGDFLVLEKDTGKVKRITNGALQSTVLDLAVNSASERGLLGLALHPDFNINGFVYLYWTESSTGIDSTNLADVALLGNRIDRYKWNGSTLTFDRNLIKLHAYQADANQTLRGNHNGGILRFGPDGKLFVLMGDNGRRGLLQNNQLGPVPDDQFGGPQPDNNHLTGFILRLNDDGSTPVDNPFYNAQTSLTGEAAANIKKLYGYGVRNGFGMAFDPLSGNLWTQENGDDCCDEMNRVSAGFNGGWIAIDGPVNRIADYKQIESTYGAGNLQQLRWPTSQIADTPAAALANLYMLPGAHYTDPEFSWKYAVAPAALGFVRGRGLGPQFEGDMLVGAARTFLDGGFLFRFKFTPDRLHYAFSDSRLNDLVADNIDKFDITESESLLIGKDFGITTDIETGLNGDLFVVSNTNGSVYEISGKQPTVFVATLNGAQETPANNSTATGTATLLLSSDETTARVSLNFSGLSSAQTAAHIHGPAAPGVSAPILFPLPDGNFSDFLISLTPTDVQNLKSGLLYVNVHSGNFSNGEIRGQLQTSLGATSLQFTSPSYSATEGAGGATITVTRFGNTTSALTVDYATTDGSASQRTDYTTAANTLHFAAGETMKSFTVPLVDDVYTEGNETVNLTLSNPTGGAFLGSPNTAMLTITDDDTGTPTTNPLDDPQFFVNQHYLDLLAREPDLGGLAYWTNEIAQCGADAACVASRRIGVSAAFFIENEFQQTGSFVYRLYKGSLGRQPNYSEFSTDRARVIGGPDLTMNKIALLNDFVLRLEFKQLYPDTMTNEQFVNKLFDTAGLFPFTSERQQLIDAMNAGLSRVRAVANVIEIQAFKDREYNPSFVLMQYFGYLRRDADPGGYAFWLDVINNREPNNYHGMVCSFITSIEYQQRFSSVAPHNNTECAGVH